MVVEFDWSEFDRGVFLVNVLGVVYDARRKKILIGRHEKDPYMPRLSWCFPGGRPGYRKDLENYLKKEVKKKTGLNTKVVQIVFAKTYPENRRIMSVYYLVKPTGGREKPGEKFVELKWVKPTEVRNYFTTSLHKNLFEFLKTLE